MSKEQLKTLQRLSQLLAEGAAGSKQIKQLSVLLAEINHPNNKAEKSSK